MKTKLIFLTAILFAVATVGFAQEKGEGDYVGNWSNSRAFELSFDSGTINFSSKGNKPEKLKYRDITPPNSETFYIEITSPTKNSYFSKYAAFSFASFDEMTMTFYKTLPDMKAKKNAQGNDTWIRGGATMENEAETFSGTLQVGKTESVILYFGEESGDYAGYCFKNNSAAGKAILKVCKDGEQCEVTGKGDYEKACKVPGLEANLSQAGHIVSVETVKMMSKKDDKKMSDKGGAMMAKATTPEMLIKDLYTVRDDMAAPFFESENRARLDSYFTKDFADLLWQNNTKSEGDIGAFEVDPLYNAQDTDIKEFKIGKPETGMGFTTVEVSFKNFGKLNTVRYLLEQGADKMWKISDVRYMNGDMLKGIVYAYLNNQE